MQPHVVDGDLLVATGAVRDDGVSPKLVPLSFPAIADVDVLLALRAAAAGHCLDSHEGVILTSDLFYPHDVQGSRLPLWQRSGVLAVEMECAPLFVIASLHGRAAGAIVAIDGNPLGHDDQDMSHYDPDRSIVHNAISLMIDIALEALAHPF